MFVRGTRVGLGVRGCAFVWCVRVGALVVDGV